VYPRREREGRRGEGEGEGEGKGGKGGATEVKNATMDDILTLLHCPVAGAALRARQRSRTTALREFARIRQGDSRLS
jgi:hypothetical protein